MNLLNCYESCIPTTFLLLDSIIPSIYYHNYCFPGTYLSFRCLYLSTSGCSNVDFYYVKYMIQHLIITKTFSQHTCISNKSSIQLNEWGKGYT